MRQAEWSGMPVLPRQLTGDAKPQVRDPLLHARLAKPLC